MTIDGDVTQGRVLHSQWMRLNGLWLHARVSRGGRPDLPLVLVHGLGMSSLYFVPLAKCLAPDFPIYAPDLPGFGRSAGPWRVLDTAELADALADWMSVAGVGAAVLIANSYGCQISVEFALRHPARTIALVLQGMTTDPHARTLRQQAWRLLHDSLNEPPHQPPVIFYDYLRCGPLRYLVTLRNMLRHPIVARLPLVQAPALVVRGTRDPIMSQRWAEEAAALLPRATLQLIPDAPHTINYSMPEPYARVLRRFFAYLPGASPSGQRQVSNESAGNPEALCN